MSQMKTTISGLTETEKAKLELLSLQLLGRANMSALIRHIASNGVVKDKESMSMSESLNGTFDVGLKKVLIVKTQA